MQLKDLGYTVRQVQSLTHRKNSMMTFIAEETIPPDVYDQLHLEAHHSLDWLITQRLEDLLDHFIKRM